MQMKLIVIRHALTESNKKRVINSQYDELLSKEGQEQIPDLLVRLQNYSFDVIYSSPLKRAVLTALPIAKERGLEINVDKRLIEVDAGSFTKKPYESTIKYFGLDSSDLLSTYDYDMTKFGGESSIQVNNRVNSFIKDLKSKPDQTILVVSHGGVIRWFYYICDNKKVGKFPNLSVHKFEI